jgi:hypothetical protein
MGSDTAIVTQKIFQLIGLTNAVSVRFFNTFALAFLTEAILVPSFMTLLEETCDIGKFQFYLTLSFTACKYD